MKALHNMDLSILNFLQLTCVFLPPSDWFPLQIGLREGQG